MNGELGGVNQAILDPRFFQSCYIQYKLVEFSKGHEISKTIFLETPMPRNQTKFFERFLP